MLWLLETRLVRMTSLRNGVYRRHMVVMERIRVRAHAHTARLDYSHEGTELLDDPEVDVVYNPVSQFTTRFHVIAPK